MTCKRTRSVVVLGAVGAAFACAVVAGMLSRGLVRAGDEPASGGQKPSATVTALAGALQDKDPSVRKAAAQSLGRIGKEATAAVPALTEALQDREVDVRGAAALALGRMGAEAKTAV